MPKVFMIKVESILKWKVEGSLLKKLKMVRAQILSKNSDAVAISDSDLHITLASGPEWKKEKNRIQLPVPEPDFRIDLEDPRKITQGNRTSWYSRVRQQKEMSQYVKDILGKVPNLNRIYHVSLANMTGRVGDSVAMVEHKQIKSNQT